MASGIVLQAKSISKSFSGTHALADVTFSVRSGQLHALLGANGSGKSTFVKILAGVEQADAGEFVIGGQSIDPTKMKPAIARSAGLHFVHQDPGVFPHLSVAENLAIGRGYPQGVAGRIDWRKLRSRSIADLEKAGLSISPDVALGEFNASTRTLVAIARALQDIEGGEGNILVLDEPTSALPVKEVAALLAALRTFTDRGVAVLMITHHLGEIIGNADQVTVLRDGKLVADVDGKDLTHDRLVHYIVGRTLDEALPQMPEPTGGAPLLEVNNLSVGPLQSISFNVLPGEVVGIAGLLGSGRSTLLRTLFGERRADTGDVLFLDKPLKLRSPRKAMAAGIGLIPEDRAGEAAFSILNVEQNVLAASIPEFWRNFHMGRRRENQEAKRLVVEFGIKTRSELSSLSSLSGGNQQKVMIARWLRRQPRLLLLDEPTQGVDVGARSDIYAIVRRAVEQGASVLLVVSDFEELAKVSDRVLVLREGRIVGEVRPPNLNPKLLTDLAYAG
jgi:ribose transport system ATP-binding protein